jgi:two-component system NtrC family response regulator
MSHDWPGNVRQLEHVITKAVVMAEGDRITAGDIELPSPEVRVEGRRSRADFARDEAERIARALVDHRWNVAEVARVLGIPRPTLYRRIKRHGLDKPRG